MNLRLRKLRDVAGASLMEIIFVLGIMAVMSPVVIKFAFKDLGDVKYLNMAKQLKDLIKSLAAFAADERDTNANTHDVSDLGNALDPLSDDMKNAFKGAKVIGENDSFVLYGIVDMSKFGLDKINFNKTLGYVGDDIGYVVKEQCNGCTDGNGCVCAVNGSWGVSWSAVKPNAVTINLDDKKTRVAVVRVNDALLAKEFESSTYLYRNKTGNGDLNRMQRNFNMGGNAIRNVKKIEAVSLTSPDVPNGMITEIASKKSTLGGGELIVNQAIRVIGQASLAFSETGHINVPRIFFQGATTLANFKTPEAVLQSVAGVRTEIVSNGGGTMDAGGTKGVVFGGSVGVQSIDVVRIKDPIEVYGFDTEAGVDAVDTVRSKLKVEVPNVNVTDSLSVKVVNVNDAKVKIGSITFENGVITMPSFAGNLKIYDIRGSTGKTWTQIYTNGFEKYTTKSNYSTSLCRKLLAFSGNATSESTTVCAEAAN